MTKINPLNLPSLPFSQKRDLPELPGIYFVINSDKQILYIGMSENIKNRWKTHHHNKTLMNVNEVQIAWLTVTNKINLGKLENELITNFKPPLNKGSGGIGGKREGSGRPKGDGKPKSRPKRIPITITDNLINNLPALRDLLADWEHQCLANESNPRYCSLRQAIEEIRQLGY